MFASAPVIDPASKIARIDINASWLTGDGRLHLVLLQTSAALVDEIEGDLTRPGTVAAIEDLLVGRAGKHTNPVLRELAPAGASAFVLAPEYALGFGDWDAVDRAVRACAQPVVLIVGFGATKGQALLDWATGTGVTKRLAVWSDAQPPSSLRPANCAFCWVHVPGRDTICAIIIKNHLEQNTEACAIAAMQEGNTLLHLRFADLDVAPMICSDLVRPVAQVGGAQERIKAYFDQFDASRPLLVAGALLQQKQNMNWDMAIDQWLNVTTVGRPGLVALANFASGASEADEATDKWRSMSGVFGRFTDLSKPQKNLDAARSLLAQGISGAVVRETRPCITGGVIAWPPYKPTGDMYVWRAGLLCSLDQSGIVAPIKLTADIATTEVARFADRYKPSGEWCPRVHDGMAAVVKHLNSGTYPESITLMRSMLHGIRVAGPLDPDAVHEVETSVAMKKAMYVLATLLTHTDLIWQQHDKEDGQLACHNLFNILVWRDAERTPGQMESDIGAWTTGFGPHPDLVVFAEGARGVPRAGRIVAGRRDNFVQPPSSNADRGILGSLGGAHKDFTSPKTSRKALSIPLQDVHTITVDYDSSAPQDQAQLEALFDRVRLELGAI